MLRPGIQTNESYRWDVFQRVGEIDQSGMPAGVHATESGALKATAIFRSG
jgi:hypothetical protein